MAKKDYYEILDVPKDSVLLIIYLTLYHHRKHLHQLQINLQLIWKPVGIMIRMYEQIGKEQMMEMHPVLRSFFGEE